MEQNLLINIYKNGEIIEFKTTLGTIVGSRKCTLNKKLDNSQETIIITAIEIKEDDHTQNNDANETLKEKKEKIFSLILSVLQLRDIILFIKKIPFFIELFLIIIYYI